MIKWFKKYFIPHEHNDHKPHILRGKATFLILGIIFLVEFIFLIQVFILFPGVKFFADILSNVLIQDTNANRLADNLPALRVNHLLTQAAQAKANNMAANGYFAHISPSGITPWYWFEQVGYKYSYAGENLAVNFSDSNDVVNAWMNSETHKDNILNSHFTEIGIGIAKGIYQGKETIFIVQMFGRPAISEAEKIALGSIEGSTETKTAAPEPTKIAGSSQTDIDELAPIIESSQPTPSINLAEKLIASPTNRTKYIYFGILGIIFLALILNIFVKIEIQHPRLIINAVVLIVVINSVLVLNQYLINVNGKI